MKILPNTPFNPTETPLFFGPPPSIARYDIQRYPIIETQIRKQVSFFWVPQEIAMTHDKREFHDMPLAYQHMFTSNLKYQIIMDTVQGRAPNLAILPFVSCPSMETWVETWAFFETIHSRSYTHIIRGLYNDPSDVFDHMLDIPEIMERAEQSSREYDRFLELANLYKQHGEGEVTIVKDGESITYNIDLYEVKKLFYKMLISIYILEGIRFYVSFACSWAFAETMKIMTKTASIIRFICRDENLHMAVVHQVLKHMHAGDEGEEWVRIADETREDVYQMFRDVADQEKAWAQYLFKDGSIIGLNAQILGEYVEFITDQRLRALRLRPMFGRSTNPLPWTENWISSKDNQPPPQEREISSYIVGGIDTNVDVGGFSDFL